MYGSVSWAFGIAWLEFDAELCRDTFADIKKRCIVVDLLWSETVNMDHRQFGLCVRLEQLLIPGVYPTIAGKKRYSRRRKVHDEV